MKPIVIGAIVMLVGAGPPSIATAQVVDTASILKAVASSVNAEVARDDSVLRVICSDAKTKACPVPARIKPMWYVSEFEGGLRLEERLAKVTGFSYRPGSRTLPKCPWYRSAPNNAGYATHATLRARSADSVSVKLILECENAPGELNTWYSYEREFVLRREHGGWVVVMVHRDVT